MCEILKRAPREIVADKVNYVWKLAHYLPPSTIRSGLQRKLTIKLAQRIALTYLKPVVASWRYQRGNRSLHLTLSSDNKQDEQKASLAATPSIGGSLSSSSSSTSTESSSSSSSSSSDVNNDDVVPQVESVVDSLLNGLRDTDTVVRWSSAKGIGRISERLSSDYADQILDAVLELFAPNESDHSWHGGCLALAELARRGLLLPPRLISVVPLTIRSLLYDIRSGTHSVGAHVRDAACYLAWSFARAYSPEIMKPYVTELSKGLLISCVFDREVNVRWAAAAAFQEHVGRQGSFPHGMDILNEAHYFTLGNPQRAFTHVAFFIAQYQEYEYPLLDHLLTVKIR